MVRVFGMAGSLLSVRLSNGGQAWKAAPGSTVSPSPGAWHRERMKIAGRSSATAAAPDAASLHAAALAHLARYAATRAGLIRVLDRRVDRWAREAGSEASAGALPGLREAVRTVVAQLAAAGAVDDAAFAAGRAGTLVRAGRSRRAIAAHLAARGVAGEDARAVLPDNPEAELAAALVLARRRRIGPFRTADRAEDPKRELGMLARAGFSHDTAARALGMDAEVAEALVLQLRRP
jgi:regulatory protein